MAQKSARPFLRWAGSKKKLIPDLTRFWDDGFTRYVEPFAGSACLYFHLQPKKAILADINKDLMHTYAQVRDNPTKVAIELSKLKRGKATYYKIRAIAPSSLSPAKRAARFIYLNRNCFNGLYRTNLAGEFNVPFGQSDALLEDPSELLAACSKSLKGVKLISGGFEKTLNHVKKGDFVYMDPPFSTKNGRGFTAYDPSSFASQDIELLRLWLNKLDKIGAAFLVSYADSQEADVLRRPFYSEKVEVRRSIAGFVSKRRVVKEVLISNTGPSKQGFNK